MKALLRIVLLKILFLCVVSSDSGYVPVLFWSPENSLSSLSDASNALDSVSKEKFHSEYVTPLFEKMSKNAVIFLQDKLHVDDFTKYADVYSIDSQGGAFKNIKALMEDNFSLELPSVLTPNSVISKAVDNFEGDVHRISSLDQLAKLDLKSDKRFIIIYNLVKTVGTDEEKAISENDAAIGSVARYLKQQNLPYSAIFTGHSSEREQPKPIQKRSVRRLLSDDVASTNGSFFNIGNNSTLLYIHYVSVVFKSASPKFSFSFNMTPTVENINNTNSDNDTGILEFMFPNQDTNTSDYKYDIKFSAKVNKTGDRWVMFDLILDMKVKGNPSAADPKNYSMPEAALSTRELDLQIPLLYSFHCTDLKLFVNPVVNKNLTNYQGSYIRFHKIQYQPFYVQHGQFFNAQDCVPFFTSAIWMGYFCTFILLAILFFGTTMVLGLTTMDRYDDAKGKTITVNVQEKD